jgi:hypothetical protein
MSFPQSTSHIVTLPMYLASDHITEAGSALSPTVTISKNGAAYANPSAGASTATSVGNNVYKFTLTTTDTDTLGDLWVRFTEATCDPIQRMLVIVKATNGGLTALPDTAVTTNASLLTSGTGADQAQVSAGVVSSNASQIGGVSATGVLVSTGVGSTAFLANAPTGGGGGSTGANPVTITIQTTSSVAIQGATVTAWKNGMIEGTLATNVSGVSVLSLDNGTYSIVVTANGYQGNTASLVVSGATSQTYQLTAITITPSPSGGVTGYLYTTDTTGTVIQSGVVVSIQMTRTASGATGEAVSPVIKTVTSDSNGLAQFVGLTPLATYRFSTTRGNSWATFVAGSSTFEITSAVV